MKRKIPAILRTFRDRLAVGRQTLVLTTVVRVHVSGPIVKIYDATVREEDCEMIYLNLDILFSKQNILGK